MERRDLEDFYEEQLKNWTLAHNNVEALKRIEKKVINFGGIDFWVQFNPARAVSTLAKVDEKSVNNRKCFLCEENRPSEQKSIEIIDDWELLVNPYPILPYHFTISNKHHIPQIFDPEIGQKLAETMPGMVVFYNDNGAGASAPDHAHFQAVPIEELPLIVLLEKQNIIGNSKIKLPFSAYTDIKEIEKVTTPINVYFWKSKTDGVKILIIPRKSHRPEQYFKSPPERRAVSPGAIDMAGVIVVPIKEDYDAITNEDIENIFSQVAFKLP